MKNVLMAIVFAVLGSGCDAARAEPLLIEGGLPDSRWIGSLSYDDSVSARVDMAYSVLIENDSMLSEFSTADYLGRALETFRFGSPGAADWLGSQGETIGTCTAVGHVLECATSVQQMLQVTRTLEFTSLELRWEETGSSQSTSYERRGVLHRQSL